MILDWALAALTCAWYYDFVRREYLSWIFALRELLEPASWKRKWREMVHPNCLTKILLSVCILIIVSRTKSSVDEEAVFNLRIEGTKQ